MENLEMALGYADVQEAFLYICAGEDKLIKLINRYFSVIFKISKPYRHVQAVPITFGGGIENK